MNDYYYLLGIKRDSTNEEIKSAYRKLSKKFHPDLNNGDKFYEERFKEIQEAYEILSNINKRRHYDSLLATHLNVKNEAYAEHKSENKFDTSFTNNADKSTRNEFNNKFRDELKSKVGKNVGGIIFVLKHAWENEKLFSILFTLIFVFGNIVFIDMHSSKNELTIGNILLTPVISAIIAIWIAGILAKIINILIKFFNNL